MTEPNTFCPYYRSQVKWTCNVSQFGLLDFSEFFGKWPDKYHLPPPWWNWPRCCIWLMQSNHQSFCWTVSFFALAMGAFKTTFIYSYSLVYECSSFWPCYWISVWGLALHEPTATELFWVMVQLCATFPGYTVAWTAPTFSQCYFHHELSQE